MIVRASAPAKVVLAGEYAVLEGAPALVAAVDRRAEVVLSVRKDERWVLVEGAGGPREGPRGDLATWPPGVCRTVFECVLAAAAVAPNRLPGLSATFDTDALHAAPGGVKLGLGSSAALAVALGAALRRLLVALGLSPPRPTASFLEDLEGHRAAQGGVGSGVDVAASVHGGVLAYRLLPEGPPEVRPVQWPPDLHFLCFWTGRAAPTGEFLDRVGAARQRDPEGYRTAITLPCRLAERIVEAVLAGRTELALARLADYGAALDAFGDWAGVPVVSPRHRALARLARGLGAAYKPSGAGGGDVGIAFASSPRVLRRLRRDARGTGAVPLELAVDPAGVRVSESR